MNIGIRFHNVKLYLKYIQRHYLQYIRNINERYQNSTKLSPTKVLTVFKKAIWLLAENNHERRNVLQGNLNIEQVHKANVRM